MHPLSSQLVASHSVIPFMLLGKRTLNTIAEPKFFVRSLRVGRILPRLLIRSQRNETSQNTRTLRTEKKMGQENVKGTGIEGCGYQCLRFRTWIGRGSAESLLGDAIRELALCNGDQAEQTLRSLSSAGVRYAAVLQAEASAKEFEHLRKLVI